MTAKKLQRRHHGFTLIELMVTIAIIAILATIGAVVYGSVQKTARVSKRVQDLKAIQTGLELYKTSTGSYPNNPSYTCVNTGGGSTTVAGLAPTYMPSIPFDPAPPNCYWYISADSGVNYKLRTGGATQGAMNADMTNAEYRTQYGMIDPKRDGSDDCVLEASNSATLLGANPNTMAWALFTPGACAL